MFNGQSSINSIFPFLLRCFVKHSLQKRIPGQETLVQPRPGSCWLFQKDSSHSFLTITFILYQSKGGYKLTSGLLSIHYSPLWNFLPKLHKTLTVWYSISSMGLCSLFFQHIILPISDHYLHYLSFGFSPFEDIAPYCSVS